MSSEGFHVHGPHDHELEHATQAVHGGGMVNQIAMFTAIIATVGAIFSYMGGATQANAGLYKNNAALKKPRPPTNGITTRPRAPSRRWPNWR